MPSLDTFDADAATTSVAVRRSFLRMGLKLDGGILTRLTWSEAYCFLQVAWNGPVRASRIFGMVPRNRERCLARLARIKWIEKTEDGYRTPVSLRPSTDEDTSYLWCWPLRFGHISVPARVLLCLIDEYTGGRYWCNRTQLAKSLGIGKKTLYTYLAELSKADLIATSGRGITCFRHLGRLRDSVLESVIRSPEYIGGPATKEDVAGLLTDVTRVPDRRSEGLAAPAPEKRSPATEKRLRHRLPRNDAPAPGKRSTGSRETHGLSSGHSLESPTPQKVGGVTSNEVAEPVPSRILLTADLIKEALNAGSAHPLLSPKPLQEALLIHKKEVEGLDPAQFLIFLKKISTATPIRTVKLFIESRTVERCIREAKEFRFQTITPDLGSVEWVYSFKNYLNHFKSSHPDLYAEARQYIHETYGVPLAKDAG